MSDPRTDELARAMVAATAPKRAELHLDLTTGRRVTLNLPADATDAELLELVANVLQVRTVLLAQRGPALVLAREPLPRTGH